MASCQCLVTYWSDGFLVDMNLLVECTTPWSMLSCTVSECELAMGSTYLVLKTSLFFLSGYYFLAALGPHMQKYLWWKKYLTTFQMFQFVCIFVKSMVLVLGFAQCGYPWQFSAIVCGLVTLMFILFAEFYVNEYKSKKSGRSTIKGKEE